MKCEQIKELIPNWLDGEVEALQAETIEKHIDTCESCRKQANFWRAVGTSLRENTEEMKTPPGFTAKVMAQLPEQTNRGIGNLVSRWKRGIAAAAAFLLVAAGSAAGYVQWVTTPAAHIVENPQDQVTIIDPVPGNDQDQEVQTPGPQVDPAGKDPDVQPNNNNSEHGNTQQSAHGNKNNQEPGNTPATGNQKPNASAPENGKHEGTINPEEYALLNVDTNRFVERTFVRVTVADLNTAHNQALSYINAAAAEYEVLGTQDTAGGGQETLKVTVDSALLGNLVENLKTLGQVISTDSQREDISARYNEKVEQYLSLEAQFEANNDQLEREQLQVKMASIKAQLKTWDKEAKTKTIILVLEK